MPEVFAFFMLNQIPVMKNVFSAFRFTLPALLLVAAFFLIASDGGHYALFPAAPDATAIVHAASTGYILPLIKTFDRFGNYYPAKELEVNSNCGCENGSGIFELTFQDVCSNRNYGFNDEEIGLARQEVVCRMFRDLSVLLNPDNMIPENLVNIEIRLSNGDGVNAMEDTDIAVASPIYYGAGYDDGIIDGLVERAIQTKLNPYIGFGNLDILQESFHGFARFNFEDFEFYLNNENWISNPTGDKDLYSAALHEAFHLLGFASLIDVQDVNRFGKLAEYGSPRCYSKYDTYLRTLNGTNTTNNGTKYYLKYPLTGDPYGVEVATSPSFLEILCTAGVEIHGFSCQNQSLYRPNPWSDRGISHFNCDASAEGGCDNHNGYVMNACAVDGEAQRHPNEAEVGMLCDLGYSLSGQYGTQSYSGAESHLIPYEEYPVCSTGVCKAVGVNDALSQTVVSGQNLVVGAAAFTENDINSSGYIFHSIELMDYNNNVGTITGAGLGFVFHASNDYAGPVILRYLPRCNDGKPGQWACIIFTVAPPRFLKQVAFLISPVMMRRQA